MFLAKVWKTTNGKKYEAWVLKKGVWDKIDKRYRQVYLAYVGTTTKISPERAAEICAKLDVSLGELSRVRRLKIVRDEQLSTGIDDPVASVKNQSPLRTASTPSIFLEDQVEHQIASSQVSLDVVSDADLRGPSSLRTDMTAPEAQMASLVQAKASQEADSKFEPEKVEGASQPATETVDSSSSLTDASELIQKLREHFGLSQTPKGYEELAMRVGVLYVNARELRRAEDQETGLRSDQLASLERLLRAPQRRPR